MLLWNTTCLAIAAVVKIVLMIIFSCQIIEHAADPAGALTDEMKAEDDYEDQQDYPNGKPLYFPFFPPGSMNFPYPAGPVLFVICK